MKEYFKPLARFKKREHPFDIGMPFSWWKGHYDRHFLNNLYKRKESEFEAFYKYHLNHFLKVNDGSQEVEFYKHVRDIIQDGVAILIKEDNPGSKTKHERTNTQKAQLRLFADYLDSIDLWTVRPQLELNAEKDNQISKLKQRVVELEIQLKEAAKHDAGEKIVIAKGGIAAFMDLIQQIQELTLPNDNKLTRSQTQSPWYKMIAKYFVHGEKDISIDTARNYFPAQKNDKPAKFIEIPEKDKLFKIVRKDDK